MFDDDNLIAKKARLSQNTLCMISKQGNDNASYYHYDVHSLYGHSQSISTSKYVWLKKISHKLKIKNKKNAI
jgi:hypothetical protein